MAFRDFLLKNALTLKHQTESLTKKETQARDEHIKTLTPLTRRTKKTYVIAMVGLVGSGKSSVAEELAARIGATVIEGDAVRTYLRTLGEKYDGTRQIVENIMQEVIRGGANVVIDSDHVDRMKRISLIKKAEDVGASTIFVQAYVSDFDILAGRIIAAEYGNNEGDFFGGAKTAWQGSDQSRGAVIKFREMWRRTPHHYTWESRGGGGWVPKTFSYVYAKVDTSKQNWRDAVSVMAGAIV